MGLESGKPLDSSHVQLRSSPPLLIPPFHLRQSYATMGRDSSEPTPLALARGRFMWGYLAFDRRKPGLRGL